MFAFNKATEIRPYTKGVSNTANILEIKSRAAHNHVNFIKHRVLGTNEGKKKRAGGQI